MELILSSCLGNTNSQDYTVHAPAIFGLLKKMLRTAPSSPCLVQCGDLSEIFIYPLIPHQLYITEAIYPMGILAELYLCV